MTLGLVVAALSFLMWPGSGAGHRALLLTSDAAPRAFDPRKVLAAFVSRVAELPRQTRMVRVSLIGAAVGVVAGVLVSAPFGLVAGGLVVGVLDGLVRSAAARKARQDLRADAVAMASLAAELRAGQPVATALRVSSGLASPSTGAALRSGANAVDVGADPTDLLAGGGVPQLVGAMWRLSLAVGCPLAQATEAVELDLREQTRHSDQVRSLLAGPMSSAMLLSVLPVFGLAMGGAVGADPWQVLTGSTIGGVLLVAGAALSAAGLLWTRAIAGKAVRAA